MQNTGWRWISEAKSLIWQLLFFLKTNFHKKEKISIVCLEILIPRKNPSISFTFSLSKWLFYFHELKLPLLNKYVSFFNPELHSPWLQPGFIREDGSICVQLVFTLVCKLMFTVKNSRCMVLPLEFELLKQQKKHLGDVDINYGFIFLFSISHSNSVSNLF